MVPIVMLNGVKHLYYCNTDVSPDFIGINMTKKSYLLTIFLVKQIELF
jgi:hypothetical protein